MKWTCKLPTEPGWYFYQRIDGDYPVRVGFVAHKTYTARWSMDLFETLTLFKHPYEEYGKIIAEITVPMRWAGPIPEPTENEKMKWTSEWPPEAGWYYCRPLSGEIIVVYVNFVNNFPFAMLDGVAVPVDACEVEWAGPIPEPTEE